MKAIHQLVAGYAKGDAISNEAVVLRSVFRQWGYDSDIFCERKRILPELRREARDIGELAGACGPDDIAFLHLSIGSSVNDVFPTLACRKALLYHNITPPEYFRLVQPSTAQFLAKGRRQAQALAGVAAVTLADSAFNASELQAWGYRVDGVFPLMLDFDRITMPPDRGTMSRFADGKTNVLVVGRCVPNKKLEDSLAAFACFQKAVRPESRLIFAGSCAGTERYQRLLAVMAGEWRLRDVVFAGAVPQAGLSACYRSARLFLCMSEHEGFCIPLLEAMAHRVPVLAYAAAAVPETMDGAGVLFREKKYEMLAEMMDGLAGEGTLREAVLARQDQRLARFKSRDLEAELRRHLAPLLG